MKEECADVIEQECIGVPHQICQNVPVQSSKQISKLVCENKYPTYNFPPVPAIIPDGNCLKNCHSKDGQAPGMEEWCQNNFKMSAPNYCNPEMCICV